MYNYPFKENEEHVLNETENVNIKFANRNILVNILLTNKNVLVFYDTEKDNAMKAGGMQVMPQYEIVFKIDLGNMDYKINEEDIAKNTLEETVVRLFEFKGDKLKEKMLTEIIKIRNEFPLWELRGFSKAEGNEK